MFRFAKTVFLRERLKEIDLITNALVPSYLMAIRPKLISSILQL